ncbi:hypothetical protein B566_EDAN005452, partial [Ephemera danica]
MRHHVTTKASCLLLLAALVNADFFYPTHDELLYSNHRGAFGRRLNLRQSGRNGFECPDEGFFADPKDCSKFYRCVNYGNGNGYAAFEFKCSEGTVFDESIIACNHPWAVNGPCSATQVSSGEMGAEQPHGPATGGKPPPTPAPEPEPEPEPTDNEIEGASTGSGSDSRPNCKEEGYFTDENDCRKFYRCVAVDTEGHFDVYRFACGPGTVFDETKRVCAHPRDVEGRCGVTEAANEVDSEDMSQSGSMESTTAGGSSSESSQSNNESPTSSSQTESSSSSSGHSESSTSSSSNNESPSESSTSSQSTTSSSSSSETSTSSSSQPSSENNESSPSGSGSSTESSGLKPSGESEDSQTQSGNDCNKPAYKGECEEEGFFPVAGDCTKFYRCVSNGKPGSFSKYDFECGEGTVFDPDNNVCNHASAVQRDCDNPESASQTMGSDNNGTESESSKPAESEGSNEVNPEDSESPSSESSSENTSAAGGSSESSTSSSENSSPAESSTESSSENSSPAEGSSESSSENSSPAESSSESSSETTTPVTSGGSSESSSSSNENSSESSTTESSSSESPSESSNESGSSESTTATSEDSSSEGTGKDQCSSEGFHPTNGDCKKFYRCVDNGKGGFDKYDFVCGDGTVFDPKHNVCNHERDVDRDCGAPASGEDQSGEKGSTPAGEEDSGSEGSGNGSEGGSSTENGSQSPTESGSSESSTEGSQTGVSPAEGEENSAGAPEEQNSTEGSSQGQSSTESSSPGNSGESTTTQSSQSSSDSGECTSEGFFPHKSDCKKFYRCVDNGKGGLTKYDFDCAEGTVFDPEINVCNHERDVQRDCSASMTTTPGSEDQETTTQAGTTQISDGEMATTTQLTVDNEPPGVESTTTTTEDPNPDEPTPPISPPCIHIDPNPPVVNCTMDGYYPDPTNCSNFYRCIGFDDENQKFNVYFFRCPNGKYYDPQRNVCDKPENIQPPRDCEAMEETTTSAATTTQSSGGETTTTDAETTTGAQTTPPEDSTTTAATETTAAQTETTTQAPNETTTPSQSETTTQPPSETTTQPPDEQQQTTTAPPETESTTPAGEQQTTTDAGETTTAAPEPEGTTTAAPESTKEPGGEETTTAMPDDSTTPASEETTPSEPADNTTTTETPPESSCDCCNLEEGQYAYICPTGFRRHPKYCNRFYQCTQKEENDVNVLVLNCPEGLVFDTAMQKCVEPDEAAPCNGEIAAEAPPAGRSSNSKIAVRVGREDLCPNTGFYPYEDDCQHFIHCQSDVQGNIR